MYSVHVLKEPVLAGYSVSHVHVNASYRVHAGQGKSWKTGISGKALVTGKSGIVRKINKSQGKMS